MKMFRSSKLQISVILLVTTMSNTEATLIDDFLPIDPNLSVTYGPAQPAGSVVDTLAGTMLSGERDMEIVQTTSRDPSLGARFFMRYEPQRWYGNEEFFFLGGQGPGLGFGGEDGILRLQYDSLGDEEGNIGIGKRLRNGGSGNSLFTASDGGVRLWVSGPDSSGLIPTTVVLRRQGATIGSFSQNVGDTDLFVPYLFPFAAEVFGKADSMTIEFIVNARSDSERNLFISHIDTIVPEGESGMAFAAGVSALALAALRKRKVSDG